MIDREGNYRNVPTPVKAGLTRFIHAWLAVLLGAVLSQFFDEAFILTKEFAGLSLPHQWFTLFGTLKLAMSTYYVGWCLMDCGVIASGLAFNGYEKGTGEPKFDRVQSMVLFKLEFSSNVKDFLASWNISAALWLKYYVYMRMLPNDRSKSTAWTQFAASLTTFTVSAIWHGFYPGFYIFFIAVAFVDYCSKWGSIKFYPLIEGKVSDTVVYCMGWIYSYSFCAYFAPAFILLSFEHSWTLYKSMNFVGHLALFACFIVVTVSPSPKKKVAASDGSDKKSADSTVKKDQ